jgi:hypothetical protein
VIEPPKNFACLTQKLHPEAFSPASDRGEAIMPPLHKPPTSQRTHLDIFIARSQSDDDASDSTGPKNVPLPVLSGIFPVILTLVVFVMIGVVYLRKYRRHRVQKTTFIKPELATNHPTDIRYQADVEMGTDTAILQPAEMPTDTSQKPNVSGSAHLGFANIPNTPSSRYELKGHSTYPIEVQGSIVENEQSGDTRNFQESLSTGPCRPCGSCPAPWHIPL